MYQVSILNKMFIWAFLVWGKSIFLVTQIFSTPCSIKNKILGLTNKFSFQRFSGFIISPCRALAKGCYSHRQKAQLFVGSHIKKIREQNFSFVKKVFFYESMRFCVCWGFWVLSWGPSMISSYYCFSDVFAKLYF